MKRQEKISDWMQPVPRPQLRNFVFFLMAVATMWAALTFVSAGFAATGAIKNAGAIVHTLYPDPTVIGAGTNLDTVKLELLDLSSQLGLCCELNREHKEKPGSCQMSCPAPTFSLLAIQAWQSPAHDLLSVRFAPFATGAPNSLLHQRLNRPPIIDRLA